MSYILHKSLKYFKFNDFLYITPFSTLYNIECNIHHTKNNVYIKLPIYHICMEAQRYNLTKYNKIKRLVIKIFPSQYIKEIII